MTHPRLIFLACFPDGREVQEAVPDAQGAGDRLLDAGVEAARQRRQDPAEVLQGDQEVYRAPWACKFCNL